MSVKGAGGVHQGWGRAGGGMCHVAEQQQVAAALDCLGEGADDPAGRVHRLGQPVVVAPFQLGEAVGSASGEGHRRLGLRLVEDVHAECPGAQDAGPAGPAGGPAPR